MKRIVRLILCSILFLNCSGDDENGNPGAFEVLEFGYFQGCGEFLDQKEYVSFKFNESTDPDGDKISYEMNFGGLIWDLPSEGVETFRGFSGFKDGVGNFRGITELNLPAEFPDFSEEKEIEFKITARDGKGGESVVSKVFNVTATDVDLGTISPPYSYVFSYDVANETIDDNVKLTFKVENEVKYSIKLKLTDGSSLTKYPFMSIYDINGEYIQSNSSGDSFLLEGTFLAGTYILKAKGTLLKSGISGVCVPIYDLRAGTITIMIE